MTFKIAFPFLICFFAIGANGAINSGVDESIRSLSEQIVSQTKIVNQLKLEISRYEKLLTQQNSQYIKAITLKKRVEEEITVSKKTMKENEQMLTESARQIQDALKMVVLQSLDEKSSPAKLLARKMLESSLIKKLNRINILLDKSRLLGKVVSDLSGKLIEYDEVEKELSYKINDFEVQKKKVAFNYVQEADLQDELITRMSKMRTQKFLQKQVIEKESGKYISPIADFLGIEHKTSGVAFKYKGVIPVVATADGRIAYLGGLSTYGNVVMIDHGLDTRSVILGQFSPKIARDSIVKKGDTIGYTRDINGGEGKVYFEVRNKSKVQNTILLLDKNSLVTINSKNKIL